MTDRANLWWKGACVYQIYPRSFADSNGDGVGDLAGITAHLDHVASLGVDAIWISPFFTSPMRDFGYDVADYCDVDPIFGTLADFDALVARAHALGLKVMIDMVFAHTSDQHAWFSESRADRTNAKSDWYVWRDANPDGTPPNNWQSVFGGPAWTWDARRQQYYMHQFLKEQPQLNCHNPAVQEACLDALRFWLARGVDGFRLDALNHAMFDPDFTDNPPAPESDKPRTRSYDFQLKTKSMNHPDVVGFVERIAAVCNAAGASFTVAEIGGDDAVTLMKAYTAGEARLNSAYSFDFLYADKLTPDLVIKTQAQWTGAPDADGPDTANMAEGWPSWAFENHDAPRHISRWVGEADRPAYARLTMALLFALRGNPFLYQGQELGLTQDEIPFELLQDPEAIANWPLTLSRDGVRTPMPWQAGAAHGGFTASHPWLPLSPANIARAVDVQEGDADSQLNWTRRLLAIRRAQPALLTGALDHAVAKGDLLTFTRREAGDVVHCAFNLGAGTMPYTAPVGATLLALNGATPTGLPPYSALFIRA